MAEFSQVYGIINSENIDELKNILDSGFDINVSGGESTLLSAAVNTGNIEIVKLLIDAGADVNIQDEYGATALFFTNYETTKLLIAAGADVNIRDEHGATALFFANYETTKLLIDAGADVNIQNSEGRTALFADDIEIEILKLLIDAGADVNIQDSEGRTALFVDDIEIEILKLLIDAGANVNIQDEYGFTVIFSAAIKNDILKLLIDAGANVNIRDEYGATALFTDDIEIEILKLLIDAGADVNIQNSEGRTALFAAVRSARVDIIKLLIDSGADVNIQQQGNTALSYTDDYDVAKLLLDAGADVNAQDREGYTVLFHANYSIKKLLVEYGADVNIKAEDESTALFSAKNIADVKFLIDSGADVNIQDMHGETALFRADNNDIFNLLVSSGADVNIQDNEGKTLLFYRADNYRIALLLGSGADVNIQDKSGKSALYYFSKKGDFENVKLLLSKGASINFPIDQISDPKIKKYLINRKTLWKSTVREKLMTKMELMYDYRSQKVCDVFNVLNKEELVMVANLYNIDEKLSRFQICQKLKDILDGKIKGKEEALGTCNNVETGILQTDIKDIDPRSFFTFEQNGKIYCEEVEALYEQIFVHGITKNAFTNQPFSEDIKKRVKKHYNIYIKDRILEEEKPQESLSALYAKLHGFLYYPVTNTKFEDSGREDLKEFVSSLPIWVQGDSDLLEYKKNIIKGLIEYIENDQDVVVQPDGRRIKTSAVLVTQIWNEYYE
jgi:ankyrin repeat protein